MYSESSYSHPQIVADAQLYERTQFIQKTYSHVAMAIVAFAILEMVFLNTTIAATLTGLFFGSGTIGILLFFVLFIGASSIARSWAESDASREKQYMGLGLFIVAEAIFFAPILYFVSINLAADVIPTAGILTLLLFSALTFIAFTSKKDFTFLGGILTVIGFAAFGIIICSFIFGYSLAGSLFAGAMVVFAGGCILYDTSKIKYHYRTDQHVAASLSLFASIAFMFYYILILVMNSGE